MGELTSYLGRLNNSPITKGQVAMFSRHWINSAKTVAEEALKRPLTNEFREQIARWSDDQHGSGPRPRVKTTFVIESSWKVLSISTGYRKYIPVWGWCYGFRTTVWVSGFGSWLEYDSLSGVQAVGVFKEGEYLQGVTWTDLTRWPELFVAEDLATARPLQ